MTRTKLFPKFSMKSIAIKSFIGALLVIIGFQTSAQQFYPVRVQPTVVFPSVFLNDYTIPENFRVLVSLNDANESDYSIFLKVRFRSDDYELNSIVGIRLTLNGGQTYMLDQQELSDLFSLGDLTITNNSSSGGSQTTLPEGIFTVSFSAFDANTPTIPVSNSLTDFTIAPVLQNDPPLLNQPSNGEEIDVQFAGQNIMFSWTPRNVAVSPTRPIKYTLKLVQVVPVDRNPYQAIQTGTFVVNNQPFDGIEYPMFIFDQSNFELLPGAVYAWQVDAYEEATVDGVLGKSTLRFKNGGASEVYTFKVKENCPEVIIQNPPVLEADPVTGKDLIALNWTPDPLHKQFEVKYREAGTILPWNVIQQAEPTFKLSEAELLRGLSYEYTVTPKCNSWQSAQYGGEFSLEKKECEAPTPILIEVNDGTILSLKWEATEFATAYKVSYAHDIDPIKTGVKDVIDGATTVSLDPITEGNYEVKVDAICGSLIDEGESMTLAYNETNVVGGCPLPSPIKFLGLRSDEMNATELDADVSWAFLDIHESYKLTWWHRDSVNNQQVVALSDPEAMIPNIIDDQLYKYTLEFTCQGGKTVTTPEGGFRIDGSATGGSTNPGTADCFPPSILSAEPRDIDEGRFEWNKVTGASEYQLHYWEEPGGQVQIFTSTAGNATIKDLIENGTYRFKVKCRCGGEFSIFSDEGILDLTSQTAKNCEQVRDFEVNTTTETEIQLQWPFPGDHDELIISGYTIRHKTEAQLWNDSYTTDFANINNLKADHMVDDTIRYTVEQLDPSTKYNFEITAKCGTDIAKANDPITGETKPEEEKDCGSDVQCDRSSTEPLAPAPQVDDTVQISDYSMRLITVEADPKGANLWKGKAIAETPMIGFSEAIQMAVAYDSLFVNDANCVTGGNMDVDLTFQILPESIRSQIKNIENLTDSLLNLAQTVIDKTQQGLDSLETYGNQALDHFQGGGGKGMPITGGLGEGIVVDQNVTVGHINYSNGQVTVHGQTADVPVLIKDNEGEVYSVDPTGHITLVGQYNDNVSISNFEEDDRVEVTFSENGDALYGFDAWQEAYGKSVAMAPHYLTIGETSYSAKAITPAMMDKVNFNIQHANKSDIIFTNGQGFVYPPDGSTLNLAGGPENDGQIIYALYVDGSDTTLAGALLVSSYPRVEKKVVLIPTAVPEGLNLDLAKIKEELDETYGQAGITYNVVLDDSYQSDMTWCSRPNCLFQPDGTGLLNNEYTGDEKAVIDGYVGQENVELEEDAAYMFLVAAPIDATKGDEGIQGKMNFGKQFGFVYSVKAQTDKKIGHIIAHEVGHGNYNLYHTFEKMYLGASSESTTDNVMDYREGHLLNKLQWDIVHDPGVTWGLFAKDDDQEKKSQKDKFCAKLASVSDPIVYSDPRYTGPFLNELYDLVDWVYKKAPTVREEIPLYDHGSVTKDGVYNRLPDMGIDNGNGRNYDPKLISYYIWRLYCAGVKVSVNHAGNVQDIMTYYSKQHPDGTFRFQNYWSKNYGLDPGMDYTIWVSTQGFIYCLKKGEATVPGQEFGVGTDSDTGKEYSFHHDDNLFKFSNGLIINGAEPFCALLRTLEKIGEIEKVTALKYNRISTKCDKIVPFEGNLIPTLTLRIDQKEISENNKTLKVIVQLDRPAIEEGHITLSVNTASSIRGLATHESEATLDGQSHGDDDGTGTGHTDYRMDLNVTIPEGALSVEVDLITVKDTYEEGDEKVTIGFAPVDPNEELKIDINYVPQDVLIMDYYYPTFAKIYQIKTYIEPDGNTKIQWRATGELNSIEYKIADVSHTKIIDNSVCVNGNCELIVSWSELRAFEPDLNPRTTEVYYTIKSKNRDDEDNKFVTSVTGDFQGDDNRKCEFEKIRLGRDGENRLNHSYIWSADFTVTSTQWANNHKSPTFEYNIIGPHTNPNEDLNRYTLQRIHSKLVDVQRDINDNHVDDVNDIEDFAYVELTTIYNCKWEIVAHDRTPQTGTGWLGVREATNNQVLQLVEPNPPSLRTNGVDAYVEVRDLNNGRNVYEDDYPKWEKFINGSKVEGDELDGETRDDIDNQETPVGLNVNNFDSRPNYYYEIKALQVSESAPKIEKNVKAQFFLENREQIEGFDAINDEVVSKFRALDDLSTALKDFEDMINEPIEEIIDGYNDIGLLPFVSHEAARIELPFRSTGTTYDVDKWIAEIYDDPRVTIDKKGRITFGFEGDLDLSLGFFGIRPEISNLAIDFDQNKRYKGRTEVTFDPAQRTWRVVFYVGKTITLFDATEVKNSNKDKKKKDRPKDSNQPQTVNCHNQGNRQCASPTMAGTRCKFCTHPGTTERYCRRWHNALNNDDSDDEDGSWWDFLEVSVGISLDVPININFNACDKGHCGAELTFSIGKVQIIPTCSVPGVSYLVDQLRVTLYNGSPESSPYPINLE